MPIFIVFLVARPGAAPSRYLSTMKENNIVTVISRVADLIRTDNADQSDRLIDVEEAQVTGSTEPLQG